MNLSKKTWIIWFQVLALFLSIDQIVSIGKLNSFIPPSSSSSYNPYKKGKLSNRYSRYKQVQPNQYNDPTQGFLNPPNQYRHAYKPTDRHDRYVGDTYRNRVDYDTIILKAWSEWSAWSKCSKSCNGGVQSRTRTCQSVEEASLGTARTCAGYDKDYQSCNRKLCLTSKEYHNQKYEQKKEQCSGFNNKPYMGQLYNWIPYIRGQFSECILYCLADGYRMFKSFGHVKDETSCGKDGRTMCINGRCTFSKAKKNDVIRTTSLPKSITSSVKNIRQKIFIRVARRFTNDNFMKLGYNEVFAIPRGATNISIEENTPSKNYLVLRLGNQFVLNGRWQVERKSKILFAAGSKISYKNDRNKETVFAVGPLTNTLRVLILFQKDKVDIAFNYSIPRELAMLNGSVLKPLYNRRQYNHFPPSNKLTNISHKNNAAPIQPYRDAAPIQPYRDQQFQYVISRVGPGGEGFEHLDREKSYKWQIGGLTRCSKPCGGGEQEFVYRCFHVNGARTGKFVEDSFCRTVKKPFPKRRICNQKPCPTRWVVSDWSACSKTCGHNSTQRRSVLCRKTQFINYTLVQNTVNDVACRKEEKPVGYRECDFIPCYYKWETSDWNECSTTCDFGFQKRRVFCKHTRGFQIPDENCEHGKKPNVTRQCLIRPCSTTWFASEWSPCNSSCNHGYQIRHVVCGTSTGTTVSESFCDMRTKPEKTQKCTGTICDNAFWVTTEWSKCSRSCGVGKQYRKVICMHQHHGLLEVKSDDMCKKHKPVNEKICRNLACSPLWYTTDWSQCSKTCGTGERRRILICLTENGAAARGCMYNTRPITFTTCNRSECPMRYNVSQSIHKQSRNRENRNRISDIAAKNKQNKFVMKSKTTTTEATTTPTTLTSTTRRIRTVSTKSQTVMESRPKTPSDILGNTTRPTKLILTTMKENAVVTTQTSETNAVTTKNNAVTTKINAVTNKHSNHKAVKSVSKSRKKQRQTSQNAQVRTSGQIFNPLRPFAYLSRSNACFDLRSPAYCYVISVRLKFCAKSRFKKLCCKTCKK